MLPLLLLLLVLVLLPMPALRFAVATPLRPARGPSPPPAKPGIRTNIPNTSIFRKN
jgi:hypothetical protein